MQLEIEIRDASLDDTALIVEYNRLLALETEDKALDVVTLDRGVHAVLSDRTRGRYFVATSGSVVIGQVMVTYEWSDWRNGRIWWLQSVYVKPEFRRRGVFRRLFEHVAELSSREPETIGIRLYVENENVAARETYQRLGMVLPGYKVMERLAE